MYLIGLFGVLMMLISAWIIARPAQFSEAIVRFGEWRPFHVFEIVTRLGFGLAFLFYAEQTRHPGLMTVVAYVLLAVGFGLVLTPPRLHRRFAAWSATAFRRAFRPAGFASLLFGGFLTWSALRGP